jgi:hypothetical protein
MLIQITAKEAMDKGVWDEICSLKHINEYAVNEGLMDSDETITLTEEEAKELGLI